MPLSNEKIYLKHWPKGVPKEIEIPKKISLVGNLEDSAKKYPNNILTYFMGFELTYPQILDIVNRIATKLTELEIRKVIA